MPFGEADLTTWELFGVWRRHGVLVCSLGYADPAGGERGAPAQLFAFAATLFLPSRFILSE